MKINKTSVHLPMKINCFKLYFFKTFQQKLNDFTPIFYNKIIHKFVHHPSGKQDGVDTLLFASKFYLFIIIEYDI